MKIKIQVNVFFSSGIGCAFHFVEIQLAFRSCFQKGLEFLTKFGSSNSSFTRNILTFLYLKFESSEHAQMAIILYYILFTCFLT